jgi:tetratricopeptide (TPR) repeat protein
VSRRAGAVGVEYSTIGETMRIADLLHQSAGAGSILIGEATRQAVERYVEVVPTNVLVTGATAFRIVGPSPVRVERPPRFARTLVPFVGRRHELGLLGREVPFRLLGRVWHGAAAVASEVAELSRLEFVYERLGGDEPALVFKHALTQDLAYDSLLDHRRRDLHLEAARALEELYPDRVDEMTATLAYHYARADLIEEAVTWLMRAADRAARVYANAEAILHLDLARRRVDRLPEGPERDRRALEIALQQAHSLYFLGRWKESIDMLLSHESRAARLNNPGLTAMLFFWLGHMYTRVGDQPRGAECAHRAIDAATRAGDEATLGKAHGVLSQVGFWSGNTKDGIAHGKMSVRLLGTRPDQHWWLGMTHFYLAINYLEASQFEKALAAAARADSVGREIGEPRLRVAVSGVCAPRSR